MNVRPAGTKPLPLPECQKLVEKFDELVEFGTGNLEFLR